jgi:[ribosomal protein S5]-alanine N-acetyltransferase
MPNTKLLRSTRLTLIASTLEHIRIELEAPGELAGLLDAEVSKAWPTGEYDRDAMEFFRGCFEQGGEAVEGWYGWYAVRDADAGAPRSLVGAAGYFGPADPEGTVEIGYSVLQEWRRRGFASEMVESLVKHAFTFGSTRRVIAHTTEANPASIAVLSRCGFRPAGIGREGALRFELPRSAGP